MRRRVSTFGTGPDTSGQTVFHEFLSQLRWGACATGSTQSLCWQGATIFTDRTRQWRVQPGQEPPPSTSTCTWSRWRSISLAGGGAS